MSSETELRKEFRRVLLVSAFASIVFLICAGFVLWTKDTYVPFNGFTQSKYFQGIKNFLYLMAMFNILIIRYVVMRIYIAPGLCDLPSIAGKLATAGISSVLISGLPCVYGLLLFLLTGDAVDFYLLFGLSLIYFMMYFPRYRNWISTAEETLNRKDEPCVVS